MLKIQLSNPRLLYKKDDEDWNIGQAIETIFPSDTEYAFIIWSNIFIPISYKYDISIMVNDLIDIMEFLDSAENELTIYWASNTFASNWNLYKKKDKVLIEAIWDNVLGELEEILNRKSQINVEITLLKDNISNILSFIKKSLIKCGYGNVLKDFDRLERYSK